VITRNSAEGIDERSQAAEIVMATIWFVLAVFCTALALWRLAGLSISKRQAECLRPELAATIRNADSAKVLELCRQYRRCSLARIGNEVVLRTRQLGGPVDSRSEVLRIVLNQACIREQRRLSRVSTILRTVAFVSGAIGMMVAASNIADALGFVNFCVPEESRMGGDISQALALLTGSLVLSLFVSLLYRYIRSSSRAELVRLQDDSSALLSDLLSCKYR